MRRRTVRTAAGAGLLALAFGLPTVVTFASTDPPQPPDTEIDRPQPGDEGATVNPSGAEEIGAAQPGDDGAVVDPVGLEDIGAAQPPLSPAEVIGRSADDASFDATVEPVTEEPDPGNGYVDPALDVGGVDGSIGADQDG